MEVSVFSKQISQNIKREQRLLARLCATQRVPTDSDFSNYQTVIVPTPALPPLRPNPFSPSQLSTVIQSNQASSKNSPISKKRTSTVE